MASTETSAGAAPPGRARFDMAERARIRAAMLRYMEAHRIGVPALQARISEAVNRPIDLIPLKTLQRFLAASTRTNDAFLVPCHRFVSGLSDYAGAKEAGPESLPRLFGEFLGGAKTELLADGAAIEGRYEVHTGPKFGQTKPRSSMMIMEEPTFTNRYPVHYSTLAVSANDGGVYAVRETVRNPARAHPFDPGKAPARHLYEGAMTGTARGLFIVVRSNLTRMPKAFALERSAANPSLYEGHGIEAPFVDPDDERSLYNLHLPFGVYRVPSESEAS
jgi:hypothetical protein